MLNKEEELDFFEILKNNFPELKGRALVIGLGEFLAPDVKLEDYICDGVSPKDAALRYIRSRVPYIVMDETEGYKCIFFKGHFIRIHYDATEHKTLRYAEETA